MKGLFVSVGIVLTALLCGCAGRAASVGASGATPAAEVCVYEVVPVDSIHLSVPDSASADYAGVLPLRMDYNVTDTAKVNSLMKFNEPYLREKGYTAHWATYSHGSTRYLAVLPSEPVMCDNVAPTATDTIPEDSCLVVAFRFNDHSKWEKITSENVGRHLAITIGGKVLSAPRVNCAIPGGSCSVTVTPAEFSEYFK